MCMEMGLPFVTHIKQYIGSIDIYFNSHDLYLAEERLHALVDLTIMCSCDGLNPYVVSLWTVGTPA